jgi:radical SAM superfamily enzyme YgiQ (UPF0313 family)
MARKLRILLADLVHDYRPNHFCTPLGVGFVAEYLRSVYGPDVDLRLFKSPATLLEAMRAKDKPDVIGLANYSWNYEINKLIMRRAAAELPDAMIVQGGPHIRIDNDGIAGHLRANPSVSYYTMFEGEYPMGNLVGEFLSKGRLVAPGECDKELPGVAFLADDNLIYKHHHSKKGDLEAIPSPYLSGMLDEFLASPLYLPLLETNRGCPFACTFCAWGISVLNKVRKFDQERICQEIDYVAKRSKATHWYFTDANFGMFERDIEIAKAIRKAADGSDYFQRLSINWAKNSSKYCIEIQKILKGICDPLVAVQSTDPKVLKHIKRDNIRMDTMIDLVEQGRRDGIAMTTDVLAGLPEETLVSHFNTLRDVFSIGFQSFNVGQIRMLPGSEMETVADRTAYDLKTQYRLIAGFFGIYDGEPVTEYEESVVETSTMSREDMYTLRVVHFLAWAMWNSGMAQPLLRYMFKAEGINPLDAILALVQEDLPVEVRTFMDDYIAEARTEWFSSAEELMAHFSTNANEMLDNEYLKLNLKYLAKILLDRKMAKAMIDVIARRCRSPVREELVRFSLDRIFFVKERVSEKSGQYSPELVAALAKIYPTVRADITPECKFSVTPKQIRAVELEMERFNYDQNPVRAIALALQNYGDKLFYDFAFGNEIERLGSETFFDSFDYANQLKTYAAHGAS